MPTTPITDWGTAIMTSLTSALAMLLAAIPKIIGFIVILAIGWFIAGLLARAVAAVLRTIKFNQLADRAGLTGFVQDMGVQTDASGVLADIVKWFVRLIVLVVAFDGLGLPAVSQVLQQFLLWIPNLIVALVVLVIAGLAARAVSDLVRGAAREAGFSNPGMLASIASVAIWAFGIIIAVNQIGIASTLVDTLFMGFVAALALALGLSFGLGGRETAAQIVQNWYQRGQQAAPKMQRAAEAAGQQAREQTQKVAGNSSGQPSTQQTGRVQEYQQPDGFENAEQNFRRHYETTYASYGYGWDQFREAYRFGYQLNADQRFSNRDWRQVEAEARGDWERSHPNAPWDRFKGAVYEGWESQHS